MVAVKLRMAQSVKDAVKFVEQGRILHVDKELTGKPYARTHT